jgi:lipid-binding SYLF domain-containing protein
MKSGLITSLVAAAAFAIAGCESATPSDPTLYNDRAKLALEQMEHTDSALQGALSNAYGYVLFPEVGKAAVGIGGANGRGVVYEQGKPTGYATLTQGSLGLQIGGETYAELIIFKDSDAMASFRNGDLTLGADASAAIVKNGAGAALQFKNGTAIIVQPKGGLMAGISINGQTIHFVRDNSAGSSGHGM